MILRDEAGEIRAHHNVCRHRGSRICLDEQGHAKRLVCPCHNWAYELNGSLCAARHLPESVDQTSLGLHPVAVRVVAGLIFVCLANDPPEFAVLNTAIINQFLDQFSRALAPDVHATLIWDGAGFHRSHDLKLPANVSLIPLPPHSPELNGLENLWHDLRSHCWSNRTDRDDDELFDVASDSWCRYGLDADLIKSVCAKNYIPTRS